MWGMVRLSQWGRPAVGRLFRILRTVSCVVAIARVFNPFGSRRIGGGGCEALIRMAYAFFGIVMYWVWAGASAVG